MFNTWQFIIVAFIGYLFIEQTITMISEVKNIINKWK